MVAQLGRYVIKKIFNAFYSIGYFFVIVRESLFFLRRKQVGFKVLVMQILFTGVEALPIIAIISIGLGAVIIIQGVSQLPRFGQGDLIYSILIIVITRELGPLLTAFIIIARSGTAIATEIGNMVTSHEIEAYISVGINPISYLAVPRFLGVTVSLLLLNLYFNIFGLVGSFFVTQLVQAVPLREYFSSLLTQLVPADIFSSLLKSLAFGVIISTVATYHGFQVDYSATETPQKVIKAVAQSFIYCIVANGVITLVYYI